MVKMGIGILCSCFSLPELFHVVNYWAQGLENVSCETKCYTCEAIIRDNLLVQKLVISRDSVIMIILITDQGV